MKKNSVLRPLFIASALWILCSGCGGSSPTGPDSSGKPRTFYVAADKGSDQNAGSASSPWLTLGHAVAQLRAGDVLLMRGGTYTGPSNVIDSERFTVPSGNGWNNAITIKGDPGELVVIRPPEGQQAIRLTVSAPHYLVFQDFMIDMSNQTLPAFVSGPAGIYVSGGSHHNRFLRLDVRNNTANGVEFSDQNGNSPNNEVVGCSLRDNGRFPAVNSGYGAYVFTSDNVFEGNEVSGNGGYGLHFYGPGHPVSRNMVRNNRIYDNGRQGGTNYGIVLASGDGNVARNNEIRGNRGGVFVFQSASNTQVEGNTIVDNVPLEGIFILEAERTSVRDNTLRGNGAGIVDQGSGTTISADAPLSTDSIPLLALNLLRRPTRH